MSRGLPAAPPTVPAMPRWVSGLTLATDLLFLGYWTITALYAAGWVAVPPDWLYRDYHDARAVAWNWSFLPLDLMVSVTGLASLAAARAGRETWRVLLALSLSLTSTAGGMAIGYWTLLGDFAPLWFAPNLVLLIWPLLALPGLIRPAYRSGRD